MNIGANITKYIAKGVGIAALGIVARDSHIMAKLQSDVYAQSKDANACLDAFSNTQYLSVPSPTLSEMKKGVFKFETDSNVRHFVNSGIGYFKGFLSTMVNNVIPVGLGLGALLGKNIVSKCCAVGLGLYAGLTFFKDVLGFGHNNPLNKKY